MIIYRSHLQDFKPQLLHKLTYLKCRFFKQRSLQITWLCTPHNSHGKLSNSLSHKLFLWRCSLRLRLSAQFSLLEMAPNTATFSWWFSPKVFSRDVYAWKASFFFIFGPALFAGHVRSCKSILAQDLLAQVCLTHTLCLLIFIFIFYFFIYLKESALETSVPDLLLPCHTFSCCFPFHKENWLLARPAHTLALIASPLQGLKAFIKTSN